MSKEQYTYIPKKELWGHTQIALAFKLEYAGDLLKLG